MNSYEQYGSNFRTETDDELEKALEQEEHVQQINTPATDDTPAPQYVDEEGETRQLVEGYVAPTPTAEEEEDPAEVKADRDFDLIEQAGNWIKTEVLGLDLDRRAAAESQDPAISEPAKAEIEAERTEFQNTYGSENVAVAAARNTTRMVTSGVEKGAQDVIGFGNFVGDLAKTKLGMVEEDDQWNNVDHAEYKGSRRDLLASQPTSSAGLFARDMVGFLGLASGVKAVTGLGKVATAAGKLGGVKGMAARSGTDLVIGALADVMADPGDGNATNMLIEFFPGLKDNAILAALAHEDDDNEFTRRLLNAVEGGVMQNAVDAAGLGINALRKGAKPLLNWIRSHPGKTAKDAPPELMQQALEAYENVIYHGTTANRAEAIAQKGFRQGGRYTNLMGEGVYFAESPRYASMYGNTVLKGGADDLNILNLEGKSVTQFGEEIGIGEPTVKMDVEGTPMKHQKNLLSGQT